MFCRGLVLRQAACGLAASSSPFHNPTDRSCKAIRDGPFAGIQVVRSGRMDHLVASLRNGDILLGKEDSNHFFFFKFDAVSDGEISSRLLTLPKEQLTFHNVVAIEGFPTDFYGDIDLPMDVEAEPILLDVILFVESEMEKFGLRGLRVVLLRSNSPIRQSFHLHIRSDNGAFVDYRAVKIIAELVNYRLKQTIFDLAVYRPRAMLRTAYSRKFIDENQVLRPYCPKDPQLQATVRSEELSPEEIMSHSLARRRTKVEKMIDASSLFHLENPSEENQTTTKAPSTGYKAFLHERNKARRFQGVLKCLDLLPDRAAEDYTTWIQVGLALHNFGADSSFLERWIQFSKRCPGKFDFRQCVSKWMKFNSRGRLEDWRQGYNYLSSTVFRDYGLTPPPRSEL